MLAQTFDNNNFIITKNKSYESVYYFLFEVWTQYSHTRTWTYNQSYEYVRETESIDLEINEVTIEVPLEGTSLYQALVLICIFKLLGQVPWLDLE